MRYGYAIRIGGDPEISGTLRDGMVKGQAARALGPRAEQGLQNVALRRHSPEELEDMIAEARVVYGGRRYMPRWAERLLAGYALICYGLSLAYRAQDRLLVSRGYQRERRAM